ncbi:snake venom serine proteinase 4a-like [Culicoides brevitarsis]|uniref:snake venom serine proteinase 4a-like n=1 Tax=Culicoides brevitarsis TaxID=469753 RepID=UPI00307B30DA
MKLIPIIAILTLCNAILPPSKIVNPGEAPFFAFIDSFITFCGGTLLQTDIVLTAAHCISAMKDEEFLWVDLGLTTIPENGDEWDADEKIQSRQVKRSRIHPEFVPDENGIQGWNDIGIILLDEPINITEFAYPIDIGTLDPSISGAVYGLGSINSTVPTYQENLRSKKIEVIDDITCTLMLHHTKYKVTKECQNICVRKGMCWGDSGGPFVQNNKLVGIISWGVDDIEGCDSDPFMLVRVYEWIFENIESIRVE